MVDVGMRLFLSLIICVFTLSPTAFSDEFSPRFYAFKNGVAFSSLDEEAIKLKELGYDGISQVFQSGAPLAHRVEIFQRHGMDVLSVYLNVNDAPIPVESIAPLAQSEAMLELTIQKESAETVAAVRKTVETAETLRIKVALYPHAGFSIATIPQALTLIEKVDHPNLGVMFNLCHFLHGEAPAELEATLERVGEKLFSVSTSGASLGKGKSWEHLIQRLDKGNFPRVRLFKKLKKMGFKGPVSVQFYGVKGDSYENLKHTHEAWEKILKEL